MAFREYFPKGRKGQGYWKEHVEVSNRFIRFPRDVWANEFGQCQFVQLLYEEDNRRIGIRPNGGGTLKVSGKGSVMSVNVSGFTKEFQLSFDKPTMYPITNLGDKTNKMRIIDLK